MDSRNYRCRAVCDRRGLDRTGNGRFARVWDERSWPVCGSWCRCDRDRLGTTHVGKACPEEPPNENSLTPRPFAHKANKANKAPTSTTDELGAFGAAISVSCVKACPVRKISPGRMSPPTGVTSRASSRAERIRSSGATHNVQPRCAREDAPDHRIAGDRGGVCSRLAAPVDTDESRN